MMFIINCFVSAFLAIFSAFAPVSTYSRETADSSEPDAFDRAWLKYEAMCDLRLMQILNGSDRLDPMDEQMIVDILHDRGFKETSFVYVGDDDDIDPYSDALLNPIEDDYDRQDYIAEKEACYICDDEPAMPNNDPIVDGEDERIPFDIDFDAYFEALAEHQREEKERLESALALNLIIRENRKIDLLMDDIASEKCAVSVRTILAKAEIRRCRELLQEIKRSKPHIGYRTLNVHQ